MSHSVLQLKFQPSERNLEDSLEQIIYFKYWGLKINTCIHLYCELFDSEKISLGLSQFCVSHKLSVRKFDVWLLPGQKKEEKLVTHMVCTVTYVVCIVCMCLRSVHGVHMICML